MTLRQKVLLCFKQLHRTRQNVFQGDATALAAGRLKINEEFRKNKTVEGEDEIKKLVQTGLDAEQYLRMMVVQAKLDKDTGSYKVKLDDDSHLNDNFPYLGGDDAPERPKRKRSRQDGCCQDKS